MQKKIYLSYLAVVMVTLFIAANLFWSKGYGILKIQNEKYFAMEANLLTEIINEYKINNPSRYYEFAEKYSEKLQSRITIIDDKGNVIADSEVDPKNMDNHASREEVEKALKGQTITAIRYSNTLKKYFTYTSTPFNDGFTKGVIRIALPITDLELIEYQVLKTIIISLVGGTLVALIIGYFLARFIVRPIDELTEAAEEISKGNYDRKIYMSQGGQIGKLANSFNNMSMTLRINMQKLTKRKTQLEGILKSMTSGIVALDEGNRIVFHNDVFKKLMNIQDSVIVKKSLYNVVRNSLLYEVIDKVRETDGEVKREGILFLEDEKNIRIYGNVIKMDNKTIGVLIVIDDITQIRKLENIRRDFVSNVTHELKTPLTSIRGFVDTLKNGAINDEAVSRRFLDIIDIEAERLYLLIQDILLLSEIESKGDGNITACNVETVIDEVIELLKPNITTQIELKTIIGNNITPYKCNRDRIKQLLINLVDNAIKSTELGSVTISCDRVKDNLVIRVEDTGAGISKEHLPRIFERFYRVDKGRWRKQGGTGLGLSIAKHIVELYNGNIKVDSEVGKGTCFTVQLPY